MPQRKMHKKQMNVQDIAEVLIQHIDELKLLENKTTQTIKNTLQQIEQQKSKEIQIDPSNYIKVANEFLTKFQESQKTSLFLMKETMQKIAEEQNKLNEQTRKLNVELYEMQTEIKKLSKVGFGRLPNYLVATLIGAFVVIVLGLFVFITLK